MAKRRGKRVVVGYVVSHTGKRGGPWEANSGDYGTPTPFLGEAQRFSNTTWRVALTFIRRRCLEARALPLVRYEVDAEEERLRDAVVDAAVAYDVEAFPGRAGGKYADLIVAVRALRAHREKVGR